jgi:hypothetical protein
MDWARILAYVTGMVDQELLARNEYLAAENRILKAQLEGRLKLSDAERATLGEGSTIAAVCSRCQSQRNYEFASHRTARDSPLPQHRMRGRTHQGHRICLATCKYRAVDPVLAGYYNRLQLRPSRSRRSAPPPWTSAALCPSSPGGGFSTHFRANPRGSGYQ